MFYNVKQGRGGEMREKEIQLLEIIRGSRDPEAVLAVAMAAVTDCQQLPVPSEAPCPAAPASAAGTAS